jgi:hypothetical protein
MANQERAQRKIEEALASVPSRKAKLVRDKDGVWIALASPSGKSGASFLEAEAYPPILGSIISELQREKSWTPTVDLIASEEGLWAVLTGSGKTGMVCLSDDDDSENKAVVGQILEDLRAEKRLSPRDNC